MIELTDNVTYSYKPIGSGGKSESHITGEGDITLSSTSNVVGSRRG